MELENLDENIKKLHEAWKSIDEKRECWRTKTKALINETLLEVKKTYDLDWNVYVMDFTKNSEGVNITFGKSPSGIYEKNENGSKSYVKNGGTLVFSQAYNGDIFVIIIYPSVEELVTTNDAHKLILKTNPNTIDREFVIKQVNNFIKEITFWENSESSSAIGYKI